MNINNIKLVMYLLTGLAAVSAGWSNEGSGIRRAGEIENLKSLRTEDWELEVLAEGLTYPWDIHVQNGLVVLTEVVGNIIVIRDGEMERFRIETSDPILQEGGSGLLGMALAGDFERSGRGFLYHSYRSGGSIRNKIIEVRFDGSSWRETSVLLEGIPGHNLYNGGRIAIGPDGALYAATGWAHIESAAQDLDSLAGKILRMNTDGSIPPDNPIPGSYVYSYGHRNPQGLAWNEDGSILYSSEHGNIGEDEINIILPGGNYGWPSISGDEEAPGVRKPVLHSGQETWAPSGIAYAYGTLLITALQGRGLYAFDDDRLIEIFSNGDRLRQVYPAGRYLYLITTNTSPRSAEPGSNDRLYRITPKQGN